MDDIELGEPADLLGLLERVALPVVRAMIRENEWVDEVSLAWEGEPPSRGRSDLLLMATFEGERFRWVVITQEAPPETEADMRSRLASDLQDFVAESRFGRGQLRPHPF